MADTLLDVINDNNEVIGQELRSVIHEKGLLHREVNVWFITPKKEIILQKRSMNKPINGGLLASAVGGHVESGSSYAQTALIEMHEETGLVALQDELHHFMTYKVERFYESSNTYNKTLRAVYGFVFNGSVDDLEIEQGQIDGFEAVPIQELIDPQQTLLDRMSPDFLTREFVPIHKELEKLVT